MPTKFRAILGDASEPGACLAHIVGVWHAVALSERTSLGHWETGSCVFLRNLVWWELGSNEER